jgi:hypothetical protein
MSYKETVREVSRARKAREEGRKAISEHKISKPKKASLKSHEAAKKSMAESAERVQNKRKKVEKHSQAHHERVGYSTFTDQLKRRMEAFNRYSKK